MGLAGRCSSLLVLRCPGEALEVSFFAQYTYYLPIWVALPVSFGLSLPSVYRGQFQMSPGSSQVCEPTRVRCWFSCKALAPCLNHSEASLGCEWWLSF